MHTGTRVCRTLLASLVALTSWSTFGQDRNVTLPVAQLEQMLQSEPLRIVSAEISRPKARGDITLKAEVAFGERAPMRIKLRKAEPGAETFNNVPRFDLAAYQLQKLLMDAHEQVVPPTAVRMLPREDLRVHMRAVYPTFRGSDDVLCVVQYWLQDVKAVEDVLDKALFQSDAVYARHIGQLNVFTYLIEHADSNVGNFLISTAQEGARVFAIDNGVAFSSEMSDRGELWRRMRVQRLPRDLAERLRGITQATLTSQLGVLAQWELRDGHYVAVALGENLKPERGVRRSETAVQMGLTIREIEDVWNRAQRLVKMIDDGDIETY